MRGAAGQARPCVVPCCAAQGNVRGLLGSLQTVLWEDSGWQPINMGDLLEPAQVRKVCARGCGAQQLGASVCRLGEGI